MAATLRLLADEGYEGITMEGVALAAGVGKATLYRRWPSKEELVLDAIRTVKPDLLLPDNGDVRSDLVDLVVGAMPRGHDPGSTQVISSMLAELHHNTELAELYRTRFLAPRRAAALEVIERGVERGELRADVDVSLVLDLLIGVVVYRGLVTGGTLDEQVASQVVDHLLDGIAVRPR